MRYTAEQEAFLTAHQWAVLATGSSDGSPQQAIVGYALDDQGRILISTQSCVSRRSV